MVENLKWNAENAKLKTKGAKQKEEKPKWNTVNAKLKTENLKLELNSTSENLE